MHHLRAPPERPGLTDMKTTHTPTEGLAIEVRDLRKSYGEVEAVRGVSFEVGWGEVFCLLGPNGAGKTSIVEILEGYRTRTHGEVRVLGMEPAQGEREFHERVGILFHVTCQPVRDRRNRHRKTLLRCASPRVPPGATSVPERLSIWLCISQP